MRTTTIAPGLTLTDQLYEAAAAGIAEHVPDLAPLTWEQFTSQAWTLIPDEQTGEMYKAELTLDKQTDARTIRMNLWFEPDLRGDGESKPHNHPWDFISHILGGTYAEDRWTVGPGGLITSEHAVEHRAGHTNRIGRETYHEVTAVDPGRTLTLMTCGPGMAAWGYLNPDTSAITTATPSEGFLARLRELNPHQG